jgi:hypothetical protein
MRCSPAAVNNTMLSLSDRVKVRLKDFCFGSLLIMNIEVPEDRVLEAFSLSSVHDNPLCIEVGGHLLPITAQVVHLVTDLPMGNKKFPELGFHDMTSTRSRFRSESKENTSVMFAHFSVYHNNVSFNIFVYKDKIRVKRHD